MVAQKLKILVVSSECTPLAKTGGLADVVGALPKALTALGHDVRVIMPWYRKQVDASGVEVQAAGGPFKLAEPLGSDAIENEFSLGQAKLPGSHVPVYLIDTPSYYDRDSLYGTSHGDFDDNAERYIFFCQAVLQAAKELDFKPDLVHCNDWHASLIPVYLKTLLSGEKWYQGIASLMTVHNLAYQGQFAHDVLPKTGLPDSVFTPEGLEFYGQLNFLKGGLVLADKISTVSKRYSKEIQTPEFGCGLEGVLIKRTADLTGILNGIDYEAWSPEKDTHLQVNYGKDSLKDKEQQKQAFLEEQGLTYDPSRPLLGMVTRLDGMKGLDLLEEIMDYLLNLDVNLAILGTGSARYEEFLAKVHATYPDRTSINILFSNRLAHQIEAASDIFLMPSRFEPCGLNQLISLRYGTLPVVRATGGLADSIEDGGDRGETGTGFVFSEYASMPFFHAIKRAVDLYRSDREAFQAMQLRAMEADFSWDAAAKEYEALFKQTMEKAKA